MELVVETIDPCRKKLKVSVPVDQVAREVDLAYERLGHTATVQGFRQGKAPRKILELHYGTQVLREVKEKLIEESFTTALRDKKIDPAISPALNAEAFALSAGEPFHYEVDVEVWPELHLGGYRGIKATRKEAAVREEEVTHYLEALRERHAEFIPVEGRNLRTGDIALVDITGSIDGKTIDERKGAWIEITEPSFIPGFCGKLDGMPRGETRTFPLVFPQETTREDLRGKEASWTVLLHEIKEKKIPELNEEFCKGVGNYASCDDLRRAIRENLAKHAEDEERRGVIDQINTYLLGHHKIPLPEGLVREETSEIARKVAGRLLGQGVKEEEIVGKKDELLSKSRVEAEKSLRLLCLYREIARHEAIAVSPEEVAARVAAIAAGIGKDPGQVRAALEKDDRLTALEEEMRKEKVADFLVSNAKIKVQKE
jgi:trigger factor